MDDAEAFRLIAENAADVVYRAELDGTIRWISPSVDSLLGRTPAEMAGGNIADHIHPDDLERVIASWRDAASTAGIGRVETRLVRRDGKSRWVAATARPMLAADGTLAGFAGDLRDITAEVDAREALAARTAELEDALAVSRTVAFHVDYASGLATLSDEALALFGLPELWRSMPMERLGVLVGSGEGAAGTPGLRDAIRTGEPTQYEVPFVRPDGGRAWVLVRTRPVRDAHGSVTGFDGVATDITETKVAQEALAERTAQLEEAERIARMGHFRVDLVAGTIIHTPSSREPFGVADGPLVRPLSDLERYATPESARVARERIATAAVTGETPDFDYEFIRADGSHGWLSLRASPIRGEAGAIVALDVTAIDISELKAAEAALAASESLLAGITGAVRDTISVQRPVRDADGAIVDIEYEWANAAWQAQVGSRAVRRPVRRGSDVMPAPATMVRAIQATLDTGQTVRLEQQVPDGRWFSVELSPLGDRVVSVARDITALKAAEATLAAAEARYRETLDGMLEGMMLIGFDWTYLYLNDAAARHGHGEREALLGRTMLAAYPGVEESEIFAHYRRVMEDRVPDTFEAPFTFADGTQEWYELRVRPVPEGISVLSIDRTGRHDAEAALEASEARYRLLADNAADIVTLATLDGAIEYVSPASRAVLGYAPEELVGLGTADLVDPEDLPRFADHARRVREGEASTVRANLRRADGGRRWVEIRARPVRDADGTIVRRISVTRDIQAQVEAEEAVARAQAELREAQRVAHVGSWWLATDSPLVHWSEELYRLHDLEPDPSGHAYADYARFMSPDDYAILDAKIQRAFVDGEPYEHFYAITLDDGSIRHFVAHGEAVRDALGAIAGLRGTLTDVTEARAAEAALRVAIAELAEAQRLAHVGSWDWDPVADTVTWSDELFRIYGLEPGGPAPSAAEQGRWTDAEGRERADAAVARSLETGEPYAVEYDIVPPDGARRRVIARGAPTLGADGSVAALRGTVADITELREAQARLDRAQRAEMVGRLAGGVAHDFNNLLMSILGYAEFLAEAIAADDPMHDDVEAIRRAGSRAADLTRQLLAFGRRQTLRPVVLDVAEVLDGLEPILRSLVGAVSLDLRPAPGLHVRVDRTSLEQAITSLVLNARDAMPGGGTVTVETATETVAAGDPRLREPAVPGDYVRMSVTDTGSGIDPEVLPHVFEPFFTTRGLGPGTGLGLSSVEGAAAQAHGFVTADSVRGEGTTFSLFLPRAEGAAALPVPERRPAVTAPAGRRGTILLVEDEPGVRAVTARTLRELGHTVTEASDASLAVGLVDAATEPFDVLVTDIVMPGMNGRELAEALVARYPGLQVIFMSAYSPETVFGDGLLPEGTPYLRKPFERSALVAQVEAALEREAAGR